MLLMVEPCNLNICCQNKRIGVHFWFLLTKIVSLNWNAFAMTCDVVLSYSATTWQCETALWKTNLRRTRVRGLPHQHASPDTTLLSFIPISATLSQKTKIRTFSFCLKRYINIYRKTIDFCGSDNKILYTKWQKVNLL